MREYRAEITLNERDSLVDLLNIEKELVKLYALALTECVSKGARSVIFSNLNQAIDEQIKAFFLLTELDYARVESAEEKDILRAREKYLETTKMLEGF